jgi:hypothetical protein
MTQARTMVDNTKKQSGTKKQIKNCRSKAKEANLSKGDRLRLLTRLLKKLKLLER